jgi:hypothetical protein
VFVADPWFLLVVVSAILSAYVLVHAATSIPR